ncbi:MAG: cytochrome C [Ignavibacteriales bacterium]|nr:MAG: cytochrome C [Ignavibacteriales bacterium]
MKIVYLYFTVLIAAIAFLLLSAFNITPPLSDNEGNSKIIKFSHSLHADLTDCATCHSAAATSTSLKDDLFPDHDNCVDCHDVENEDECSTCHYDNNYEPLMQNEVDLYFNHKYHIEDKGLECESCHKGISEVDYSMSALQPNPVMEDCYSCHNNITVASNTCESCHISTSNLIPQSHQTASFIKMHKFEARAFDANCVMCHDNISNDCIECHEATNVITELNMPDNFYQPYSPLQFSDGPKKQKIARVHELNYRFFHGIDAKGKTTDCQTCHDVDTFCANCHQSEGGDFAMGGIQPITHFNNDFIIPGVGAGGGDHSTLAKRDIESCISCHDVQGADPTCTAFCHVDPDGIKGNNPKTHASNFMRDNYGDWHNDFGSLCYNCHTSQSPSSPAGMGFCGYCHGTDVN